MNNYYPKAYDLIYCYKVIKKKYPLPADAALEKFHQVAIYIGKGKTLIIPKVIRYIYLIRFALWSISLSISLGHNELIVSGSS